MISAVIPTYGRAERLRHAVSSALAQTKHISEVIVVDDGSSPPIQPQHLPDDARLRVVRQEINLGPAAARNAGVRSAKNEWISFLDSDDVWLPDKLERQVSHVRSRRASGLVVSMTGWRELANGTDLPAVVPKEAASLADFAKGSWFSPGSTALIHRSVFDRVGPFCEELRRLEDYEWFLRFGRLGGQLIVVPEVLSVLSRHRSIDAETVQTAAHHLASRFLDEGSPEYIQPRQVRKRVKAYLKLVEASANWYAGNRAKCALLLCESFFANPRMQLAN